MVLSSWGNPTNRSQRPGGGGQQAGLENRQKVNPEGDTWVKDRRMGSSQGFTGEKEEKGIGGNAGTGITILLIII